MKIGCVIPARFGSTRLPGKPLADIAGKPMIQRVYERVTNAKKPEVFIVATDDQRVYDAVQSFGGTVVMTDANHPTGTDRLAEVAQQYTDLDVIINVQGDEPMIDANLIDQLAELFESDDVLQMATVATPLLEEEYDEPSAVKVILNKRNDAMYFSRSLIPYPRHDFVNTPLKHIGIYAYRRQFLLDYAKMEPTAAEQTESLEQLRALENGFAIRVITTDKRFVGVDTPEDLARVNAIFEQEEK
ncbi:3-deoxy-manno-octulosonate cytidylyltransferase [Veillonella tobetsuensis]|uniref:3-deoxy-manno-octulosonate cytidylyltransferase n=1 Tax=Veillonella tobetsuensis TaxID=1110546 RepID=A0A2S7ZRI5_9FIRM|nr:3-deoxy-manno-octulosonate cytidylyltransferase [Veillonella tobetsuensis]PQL25871.1 3-deoxy-manno-octulosonate cytidylyltransferase [Veillonella tobetsuensis]GCL67507.1 3-deoxy-manno-octulosonate cytidylyltransferase [Veillonella tobetsuensis]